MGLYVSEPYSYGDDRDGNRGEMYRDYIVYSDVSGKELDVDDIYLYEDEYMSLEELKEKVVDKVPSITPDKAKAVYCTTCGDIIDLTDKEAVDYLITSTELGTIYCCEEDLDDDLNKRFKVNYDNLDFSDLY